MQIGSATTRARRAGLDFWFPLLAIVGVAILSALSISGSSTAIWSSSGKQNTGIVIAGTSRGIRSDEWLATTPLKTGRVRAGFPEHQTLGMGSTDAGASWRPQLPQRSLPGALYAPFNVPLAWLPLAQGFALYWWLPFLACALGTYAWLRLLGVSKGVGFAAAMLVTTAPAVVWWSGWVGETIALAVVPCALLIAGARVFPKRAGVGALLGVVAGLSAAGLPWFYQPWQIPVALFVGGVTLLWGFGTRENRKPFLVVGCAAGAVFAIESLAYLIHERSYYEALADTAYPGQRREVGGGVSLGRLFSSLFPFSLARGPGRSLAAENLSEVAMGWTVALPVALGGGALGRRALRRDDERIMLFGALGLALVVSSWCFIAWPKVLGELTALTFSPAPRVAPFVGFFGVVIMALFLGNPERRQRLFADIGMSGAVAIGVAVVLLSGWAANDFRALYLPGLSNARIYLAALVMAVLATFLFTRWWTWALGVAVVLSVASGVIVNPLIHGLGAIDSSRPARVVNQVDDRVVAPTHGNWAADSLYTNGLLNAQGVDSLSSYNDPVDKKAWRKLDPHDRYIYNWNRFGYIIFDWVPGQPAPVITAPVADQIHVAVDPCDPRLDALRLRAVVSSHALDASCLTPSGSVEWMGVHTHIYERHLSN